MRVSPVREWMALGAGLLGYSAGLLVLFHLSDLFHLPEPVRVIGVAALTYAGFGWFGWFRRKYMFQGACATKPKSELDR